MNLHRPDFIFLATLGLLLIVGISFEFSASYAIAEKLSGDPFYYFKRQLVSLLIGIVVFGWAYRTDPQVWLKYSTELMIAAIVMLLIVFIPVIGKKVSGSRRWINLIVLQFQPSEMAKVFLVFYLSVVLHKRREMLTEFTSGMLKPMGFALAVIVLIALEPDFSTAVLTLSVAFLLFYLAGTPPIYLGFLVALSLPFVVVFFEYKTYAIRRLVFFDPFLDPFGRGYHLIQSFQGFKNGGILGAGPGNGIQKLGRLPEAHTDFIFSVIGEEMGLIGAVLVLLIFGVLIWRGLRIAMKQTDFSYFLIASGLAAFFALETIIHISVTIGLMPTTGLPLPLVSYGRTSMVMTLFSAGVLLRLSRHIEPTMAEKIHAHSSHH